MLGRMIADHHKSLEESPDIQKVMKSSIRQMRKRSIEELPSEYPRDNLWFRPSGLHRACARSMVFNYWMPQPREGFNFSSSVFMSSGTAIHTEIQRRLYNQLWGTWRVDGPLSYTHCFGFSPLNTYTEPNYRCDIMFTSGSTDGIFWPFPDKEMSLKHALLLEIKTTSPRNYDNITTAADIPDGYKMQAEMYQFFFEKPATWFLYVCRATARAKFILYPGSGNYWKAAKRKMVSVIQAIKHEDLSFVPPCGGVCSCQECGQKDYEDLIRSSRLRFINSDLYLDLTNWRELSDNALHKETLFRNYT